MREKPPLSGATHYSVHAALNPRARKLKEKGKDYVSRDTASKLLFSSCPSLCLFIRSSHRGCQPSPQRVSYAVTTAAAGDAKIVRSRDGRCELVKVFSSIS